MSCVNIGHVCKLCVHLLQGLVSATGYPYDDSYKMQASVNWCYWQEVVCYFELEGTSKVQSTSSISYLIFSCFIITQVLGSLTLSCSYIVQGHVCTN